MSIVSSFLNLKLRIKLLIAFGSLILLTVVLVAIFFYTLQRVDVYEHASEEVDAVNIDVLNMDAGTNYFIFEGYKKDDFQTKGTSPQLTAYAGQLQQIRLHLESLQQLPFNGRDSLLRIVNTTLQSLDTGIEEVTRLFKVRGFKDYGLEGKLRTVIHNVEKSSYPYDKADMLMLRRHEKDFFLRKDLKYQKEFNDKIEAFQGKLSEKTASAEQQAIVASLRQYREQFNEIIAVEQQIGLKETDGLKGSINGDLAKLKSLTSGMRSSIKTASATFKEKSLAGLTILFGIQLLLGILLAIVYADIITRAIKQLKHAIEEFAGGKFPAPLAVKSHEEIGKTKTAFNQLLDRMKAATQFASSLGDGHLETHYDNQYADDILARSLIKMRDQLSEAHALQAVENWTNTGLARMNDVLKRESADVAAIADEILSLMVRYVKVNQGALYLLEGEGNNQYLERVATYAYAKRKFIEQRINIGQGLVGQCVLEKSTMILTQLPKDYIRITSGLGEALPGFVVILPLKIQERVMGVLELASFEALKNHEVAFLEKIAENIASLLSSRKTAAVTLQLLNDARLQTQKLAAQEEEIRQNAEEMQAIQEQMLREKLLLEKEVAILKTRVARDARETDLESEENDDPVLLRDKMSFR